MFRVGQKVVCVNNRGVPNPYKSDLHTVYTIATVRYIDRSCGCDDTGWGVTLLELPTHETEDYLAEFRAERFRPAVDRPTDISVFTRMLTPASRELVGVV